MQLRSLLVPDTDNCALWSCIISISRHPWVDELHLLQWHMRIGLRFTVFIMEVILLICIEVMSAYFPESMLRTSPRG